MNQISNYLKYFNNEVYFNFNKWGILFYFNLIIYGFYGALIPKNLDVFIFITILITIIQTIFGLLLINNDKTHHFKFKIDFKVLFLFLFFIITTSFFNINNPLLGDELSYTQSAIRHSIILSEYLTTKFLIFNDIKFIYLIYFINIFILCFFILLIFVFNLFKKKIKLVLSIVFLITTRIIIFKIGGNSSPHPPLNHLSTLLFSFLMPESYTLIRLSYIIPFSILCISLYNLLNIRYNRLISFLFIIFYSTLPVLFFLSHTVEQSLWSTFIFTYILVYLYLKNQYNYSLIIFLLSIFTLFRLPTILYFIPITIFYIYNIKKFDKNIFNFIPILIFVPFLIYFSVAGTASFDTISNHSSLYDRYVYALNSGIIIISFLKFIPIYLIISLLFLPITSNKIFNITIIFTFICVHILFYSINPNTWGFQKYQSEIYIPFIFLGTLIFFNKLNCHYIILPILIFLNLYNITNSKTDPISNINKYYPYDSAYEFIKNIKAENSTYSLGLTYGILPEILNGYSVRDVIKVKQKYKSLENYLQPSLNQNNILKFLNILTKDHEINYLIIGYTADKRLIIKYLLLNKWKLKKSFISNNINHEVLLFSKS